MKRLENNMNIKIPKNIILKSKEEAIEFVANEIKFVSGLIEKLDSIMNSFDEPKPSKLEALFLDPKHTGSNQSMRDIFREFNDCMMIAINKINQNARFQDPQIVSAMRKELSSQIAKNNEWLRLCNMNESERQIEIQKLIDSNPEKIYSRDFSFKGLSFTPIAPPTALLANNH